MRGAHIRRPLLRGQGRIIPADAGSTMMAKCIITDTEDHPRRCGEHNNYVRDVTSHKGSSPQMRGAPMSWRWLYRLTGIIPADAGSTGVTIGSEAMRQDHPRRCGEHVRLARHNRTNEGSSPQMRGALARNCGYVCLKRIIPADAGSTNRYLPVSIFIKDHPRRCGEHLEP